ncbi:N-acetyl-gamma-glutamyl-phosphate reductase [Schumannella luteola]|uniref:N-acetyl-gamma-glutamyl-phosphate reductase n=1 Tax=Schumannella luteola TaxID=472059 RepID=A0A852YRA8_9MICO|nr:N-acetyl-gamma-glutamyl-phosphate reductase [Schumannella luteola]NYH00240.1 N-acetyl-gamma-glutamyl-phosphate reductase [Schumannella luteola]TPX04015.1 N-acetyl-gamma-glutamyl-phosphate reductase [Schumannella luteola]
MSYSVAVAGASGYAGGELLRLLAAHPEFQVTTVTAHSNAGEKLAAVHPHLLTYAELVLKPTEAASLVGHDVVFLALPHGASGAITAELPDDVLVVDCGADHRLTDPEAWATWYGGEYYGAWTYGMPELPRADADTPATATAAAQRAELAQTKRIAVPGCNVSAVTFGLAPGIAAGVIQADDLVSVLSVGTSGAGKSLKTNLLASEIAGSASAYGVGGVHRHVPEIIQNLTAAGGTGVSISFTPVLVPMSRGILATSTAKLAPGVTAAEVRAAWQAAYADEPFAHLLPEGVFPRSGDTTGANTVLVGLAVDERAGRVVVVSALDNLVKGTAGAAIQSANLALGLDETLGLPVNGVAP